MHDIDDAEAYAARALGGHIAGPRQGRPYPSDEDRDDALAYALGYLWRLGLFYPPGLGGTLLEPRIRSSYPFQRIGYGMLRRRLIDYDRRVHKARHTSRPPEVPYVPEQDMRTYEDPEPELLDVRLLTPREREYRSRLLDAADAYPRRDGGFLSQFNGEVEVVRAAYEAQGYTSTDT